MSDHAALIALLAAVPKLTVDDATSAAFGNRVWTSLLAHHGRAREAGEHDLAAGIWSVATKLRARVDAFLWPSRWIVKRVVPELMLPDEAAAFAADPERFARIADATVYPAGPPVIPGVVWGRVAAGEGAP